MADEVLSDKDEDEVLEIVEVDELPPAGAKPAKEEPEGDDDDAEAEAGAEDDDDEDDEDERLAASDEEIDDNVASKSREKRLKRREMQRAARERTEQALQNVQRVNQALVKRLEALESGASQQTLSQIEAELSSAQADVTQAEALMAQAIEAGDGAAASEALRLRDAARDREVVLKARKEQRSSPAAPSTQRIALAQAWVAANPWYNPNGQDLASSTARDLDAQMQSEGFDPDSVEFWRELSRRVERKFKAPAPTGGKAKEAKVDEPSGSKRKGPPVGGANGARTPIHGTNTVHVTPERKQAMVDAGVWDDPQKRNRMLKAYRDFDRNQASAK